MNDKKLGDIRRFLARKKTLRIWRRVLAGLAAAVVFFTAVFMINPAIATIVDPGQGSELLPGAEGTESVQDPGAGDRVPMDQLSAGEDTGAEAGAEIAETELVVTEAPVEPATAAAEYTEVPAEPEQIPPATEQMPAESIPVTTEIAVISGGTEYFLAETQAPEEAGTTAAQPEVSAVEVGSEAVNTEAETPGTEGQAAAEEATASAAETASAEGETLPAVEETTAAVPSGITSITTDGWNAQNGEMLDFPLSLSRETKLFTRELPLPEETPQEENWAEVGEETVLKNGAPLRFQLVFDLEAGVLQGKNAKTEYVLPKEICLTEQEMDEILHGKIPEERETSFGQTRILDQAGTVLATYNIEIKRDELTAEITERKLVITFTDETYKKNIAGEAIRGYLEFDTNVDQITFLEDATLELRLGGENTPEKEVVLKLRKEQPESETVPQTLPENSEGETLSQEEISETGETLSETGEGTTLEIPSGVETFMSGEAETAAVEGVAGERHSEGEDFTVTVKYGADAGFPENVELHVSEIRNEGDTAELYQFYLTQAQQAVEMGLAQKLEARFFDITFTANGAETEPLAPVQVAIQYGKPEALPEEASATVIHFEQEKEAEEVTPVVLENVTEKVQEENVENVVNAGGAESASAVQAVEVAFDAPAGQDAAGTAEVVETAEAVETGAVAETTETAPAEGAVETTAVDETTGEVVFETEGFSVYGIVYTVDFAYEVNGKKYDFSMPGGGAISLSYLVETLGIVSDDSDTEVNEIQQLLDDVERIECSGDELISASKVEEDTTVEVIKERLGLVCEYSADLTKEQIAIVNAQQLKAGDWVLISLKPFTSVETLSITMKNGDKWTVQMTDAQLVTYYLSDAGDLIEVVVSYGEEARIPEGSRLEVREFAPDSEEFLEARQTILDSEFRQMESTFDDESEVRASEQDESDPFLRNEENMENVAENTNFHAFDVTIYDENGIEVEPQAPVHVSITLQYAASEEERQCISDTLEVHHLLTSDDELIVEEVLPASTPGQEREVSVDSDTVKMDFVTTSFSTYTVNWNTRYYGTITLKFESVDEQGRSVNGKAGSTSFTHYSGDRDYSAADFGTIIEGYEYAGAQYSNNNQWYSFENLRLTPNTTWYYSNGRWVSGGTAYNRVFFMNGTTPIHTEQYNLRTDNTINIRLIYRERQQRKVHYGYIENGVFVEWENERIQDIDMPSFIGDQYNVRKEFQGKDYVTTKLNDPISGTSISPLFQTEKNSALYWRYRVQSTTTVNGGINEWQQFGKNDNDIYVIYRDTPTQKSYDTGDIDPEDLAAPAATKNFEQNGDGTYDLILGVTGKSNQAQQKNHANIVIVMDTSSSMDNKYSENPRVDLDYSRLSAAKSAVCKLADQLFALNSTEDPAAIELAFVNFSHRVRNEQTMQTIYSGTSAQSFKNMINATNGNGGTNYDTAIEAANSILWNDADPTYVVFVTDGDTVSRGYLKYDNNGTGSDHARDWDGGTYYNNDETTYGNAYLERAREAAKIQVDKILNSGKKFYSIGVFGNVAYLEEMGGTYLGQANDQEAIESAFSRILSEIQLDLGYQDVVVNDGLTALTSTTVEHGAAGNFTYYRSGGKNAGGTEKYSSSANNGRGESWNLKGTEKEAFFLEIKDENTFYKNGTLWTDLSANEKAAYLEKYGVGSRTVVWDLGSEMLEDGVTYKVAFTIWPSQEAYDLVANLNNGTVQFDDLDASVKAQIVETNGVYYVRTNTKASVDYKSVRTENGVVTEEKTGSATIKDPEGKMNLDTNIMTVTKEFAHLINEADPYEQIAFYLLVDGKYYNKDGSLSETLDETKVYSMILPKDGKWEDQIYIAPGLMRGGEVLETGHQYSLVEKILSGNPYEYEFASQTVRPMVIHTVPTFLVKKDSYNTNADGKKEYTFNDAEGSYIEVTGTSDAAGTYYAASENNGALSGVNHKTSELDITKIIKDPDNLLTDAQEASETFTYRVTLQIPAGSDPSGIVGYEYVPRTQSNAFTLYGYQSGQNGLKAFPEDVARFSGKTYRAWNTLVYDALIEYDRIVEGERTYIKAKRDENGNITWKVPAVDGYHTITYDMTLKQDEVIRFTNLPTGTKYKIQEIYANKYPADNIGGKTDGRAPVADGSNLAAEGYVIEGVRHTGGTLSADLTTVEGTIEAPDTRYYNQFTNKRTTENTTTRAKLKEKKVVKDYTWGEEYYRFTLTPGTAEYTDTEGGSGTAPLPDENQTSAAVSVYQTTAEHTLSFGAILYKRPGIYTYRISEYDNTKNLPNVQFASPVTITVTVTEDSEGKLHVESITDDQNVTAYSAEEGSAIAAGLITMTNTTKKIQIRKVDKTNPDTVLSDALFEIRTGGAKLYLQGEKLLSAAEVAEIIEMPVTENGAGEAMETQGIRSNFTLGEIEISSFTYDTVYELKEMTPPAGYIITNGSIYFKAVRQEAQTYLRLTDQNGNMLSDESGRAVLDNSSATVSENGLSISVKNEPGVELPSTGGPGNGLFFFAGIMLLALAATGGVLRRSV